MMEDAEGACAANGYNESEVTRSMVMRVTH